MFKFVPSCNPAVYSKMTKIYIDMT